MPGWSNRVLRPRRIARRGPVKQFDNRDEAGRLAREIGFLIGSGTSPEEIAVLFAAAGDSSANWRTG